MLQLLLIALGGAAGALSRYGVGQFARGLVYHHWPLGTFLVNITGSFLIGLAFVTITEKAAIHSDWRYVLIVGFLGAFTTFSTFSLETVTMLEAGRIGLAMSYALSSVGLCLLGCWLAIVISR
ncbi:fluoride efflux transporter CrcB [Spongiibacter sp. KMU-158]|uniref:Fluoride-specific ion channel FluC n=1 Tax=Spongiibacter pelagi TaxID=2760804 RepID=A0A927C0Z7_9GAMM|nr:fluoride efflux transporter CrcB [Spongiibacter pelagi]MBD2859260.1 fluoride efflux transporter CrcB [Spongiibacter pelagi]